MKSQIKSFFILIILSLTFATACSKKTTVYKEAQTATAPTNANDVGVSVFNIEADAINSLIDAYPETKVRVAHSTHNIYEIFGLPLEVIKKHFESTSAVIENNQFFEIQKNRSPTSLQTVSDLLAYDFSNLEKSSTSNSLNSKDIQEFIESCNPNPFARPKIRIRSNIQRDRIDSSFLAVLGTTVILDVNLSEAQIDNKSLDITMIFSPNSDSHLQAAAFRTKQIQFTPDTYGDYKYTIIAKDVQKNCAIAQDSVFVTDSGVALNNTALDLDREAALLQRIFQPSGESSLKNEFWNIFSVGLDKSWSLSTGQNVVIAIIDTGVNYNHPLLNRNIFVNNREIPNNGKDDDGNGFVDDVFGWDFGNADAFPFDNDGHGSHCAGTAAARVFGAAKEAKILPVKVSAGSGIDPVSIAAGIYYAVDMGAQVISISLVSPYDLAVLRSALAYAESKNVVVAAGAGNGDKRGNGLNNDFQPIFPANYNLSNLISVAATNKYNTLTKYSNFGKKSVHVAAPGGEAVLGANGKIDPSDLITSTYKEIPKVSAGSLKGMQGTSMATPLVAGIAAQLVAFKKGLSAAQIKTILIESSIKNNDLRDKSQSEGIVNSFEALSLLKKRSLDHDNQYELPFLR